MAWHEAVAITAKQEALPVVHCPSWLARSGLPTLLGPVVDMLGPGYAFWASSVETFYSREHKLEEARRYWGRETCFRFHYVTPGKGDMVPDDRARVFHDPTLLWWDETAQLLRRARALRSTNPMARQLRAVYEALRRRIGTLPLFLESDPSFEFEERPNWCNALHAVDEIEDQELDNLIARALFHAKQAFRGLAGELDRRVRGWFRANSTMGAVALHKWAYLRSRSAPGRRLFLGGSIRSRCMACSSLGSLRRRCVLFEGRQRERAPRWVKADVSRHCLPWRWGSTIRRRRLSETCWSSGSTSSSISQRPSAKECTVLGTWRNLALFRLPGGSAGTESRAL